jgi:hypothetical protein
MNQSGSFSKHDLIIKLTSAFLAFTVSVWFNSAPVVFAASSSPTAAGDTKGRYNPFPSFDASSITSPQSSPQGINSASRLSVAQNSKIGSNFSNYRKTNGQTAYADMRAAGVKYDRVVFDVAYLMHGPGSWKWENYDALVNDARANGIEIMGVFMNSALWMADAPNAPGIFKVPSNLHLPWNHGDNKWGNFVHTVVNRYKDRVNSWEVWNEPNLGEFWQGTPQQFAHLMKSSYQAARAADGDAVIAFGGVYRDVNLDRSKALWQALSSLPDAKANNYFFDVMGYHLYDGGSCSTDDEIGRIRAAWMPYFGHKTVWITETGIRVWDAPQSGFATPDESASFVIQNYAYSIYAGAMRYMFFRAIDPDRNDPQPWGLLRVDGSPRPSYYALKTAATSLPEHHEYAVRAWHDGNKVSRITYYNTNLGRVSILWNMSNRPYTFRYGAMTKNVKIVRPTGESSVISSPNNWHDIRLEPARNFRWNAPDGKCQVPGEPVILIESDTKAPTASMNLMPATVNTDVIVVSWKGEDNGDPATTTGVWAYDVQYQVEQEGWKPLLEFLDTPGFPARLNLNQNVAFRVRARDRAGNLGAWSAPMTTRFVQP